MSQANDPLATLTTDRTRAREAKDPMAGVAIVASVTPAGEPAARTLVLRDLDGALALFINQTSPKMVEFAQTETIALVVWLPSIQVQYRLTCHLEPIPSDVVHDSWQLRPDVPKKMDWVYAEHPQSTPIADRDALLEVLPSDVPETAPDSAAGFFLDVDAVERLDLGQANGVHDRRRFQRTDGGWNETVLVP